MENFIQPKDYKLFDEITEGPTISIKIVDGKNVGKTMNEYVDNDLISLKNNAKDKNILVCGIGLDMYNRVSSHTIEKIN